VRLVVDLAALRLHERLERIRMVSASARSMDSLETKIDNGRLTVRYEYIRSGEPGKKSAVEIATK
jgi:hypothetical protein